MQIKDFIVLIYPPKYIRPYYEYIKKLYHKNGGQNSHMFYHASITCNLISYVSNFIVYWKNVSGINNS